MMHRYRKSSFGFGTAAVLLCVCLAGMGQVAKPAAVALPELMLQTGHSKAVVALAISPDKRWIASGSFDNTIRIWDPETGRELRSMTGHTAVIRSLACTPDGLTLVSGSNDKTLRLWNVASGREIRRYDDPAGTVETVAISFDGRLVASAGSAGTIVVRDIGTWQETARLPGHTGGVTALSFSRDGKLASIGQDQMVRVWDIARQKAVLTVAENIGESKALTFNSSGDILAAAGSDKTVRFWSITTRKKLGSFTVSETPLSLGFVSALLTVIDMDGNITTADVSSPGSTTALSLKKVDIRGGEAECAAISADGSFAAVGLGDGSVLLVDPAAASVVRVLDNRTVGYYGVAFSPDREWLAAAGYDNTVKLWDLKTGRSLPSLRGHTGRVTAVQFSPDSLKVVSSSVDHTIRVWDIVTGRCKSTLSGHTNSVSSLSISKSGKFIVSGGADGTIGIWDLAMPDSPRFLRGHEGEVISVRTSPDEKTVVSAGADGTIRIWSVEAGQIVRVLDPHAGEIDSVAISPDGRSIAAGGIDRKVRLFDAASGSLIKTMPGHDGTINSVEFSPSGAKLVTGGHDRTVRLWDIATGTCEKVTAWHSGTVYQASFSTDGKFLASTGDDGSIVLSTAAGERLATLVSIRNSDDWLTVAPNGVFDGSPAAWQQVSWRFEGSTFNTQPVEVFFNEFFSPGLLSDIMSGRPLPSNTNITQKDRRQPVLEISAIDPMPVEKEKERTVTVRVKVVKAPAGAKDVRLFRNGALVKVWRGDVLRGNGNADLTFPVPIVAGENRLTAYAFNRDDIKSTDASLSVNGPKQESRRGTAYFFAIGINSYSNPEFNLTFAVPDADDFVAEMKRQQLALDRFADIKVISIKDAEATKGNIMTALNDLTAKVGPEDVLIIYYAGHGTAQQNSFYLIPHDLGYVGSRAELGAAALQSILNHSISDAELGAAVEGLDARQLVMVIDACNSGQALETDDKRLGPMNSKGLAQLAYEKGMYILTAAQSDQAAKEATRLGHGFLTYALVEEGLKTAAADDSPRDGQVLLREWLDFAAKRVPEIQEDEIRTRQLEREKAKAPGNAADIQRPRVFYRREADRSPLVVARP